MVLNDGKEDDVITIEILDDDSDDDEEELEKEEDNGKNDAKMRSSSSTEEDDEDEGDDFYVAQHHRQQKQQQQQNASFKEKEEVKKKEEDKDSKLTTTTMVSDGNAFTSTTDAVAAKTTMVKSSSEKEEEKEKGDDEFAKKAPLLLASPQPKKAPANVPPPVPPPSLPLPRAPVVAPQPAQPAAVPPPPKPTSKPKKKKRELREIPEDHRGKPVTYEIDCKELFAKSFDRREVLREVLERKGVAYSSSSSAKNNKKKEAEGEHLETTLTPKEIEELNLIKRKALLENDETIEKADVENVKELVEDFASFFIATFDEKRKKWAKKCFRENAKRRKAKAEENAKNGKGILTDGLERTFEAPASNADFEKMMLDPKKMSMGKKADALAVSAAVNRMPKCRVRESAFGVTKTEREMMVPAVRIRPVSNVPEYRAYTYSVHENIRGSEEEKRRKLLISDQDGEYRVANENDSDYSDEEEDFETGEEQYPWHRRDDLLLHSCVKYIIGESSKLDEFLIQEVSEPAMAANGKAAAAVEEKEEANPSKIEDTTNTTTTNETTTKMEVEDVAITGEERVETEDKDEEVEVKKDAMDKEEDKNGKENNLSDNDKTNTVATQTKRQYTAIDIKAKQIFETTLSTLASYITGVPPVNFIALRVKLLRDQESGIRDIAKDIESAHDKNAKNNKPTKKKKAASTSLPKLKTIEAIAKEVISRESIDFLPRRLHEYKNMEAAMDSFRTLFCPRCHSYSCQIHGNGHLPSVGRRILTNYKPEWNKGKIGHPGGPQQKKKKGYVPVPGRRAERHRSKETIDANADANSPADMDVDDTNNDRKEDGGQMHTDINNNADSNEEGGDKETPLKSDPEANYLALAKPKDPCRSSQCWRSNEALFALMKKLQPPWLPPSDRVFCSPIPAENNDKAIDPMDISEAVMADFLCRDKSITDENLLSIAQKLKHSTKWENWVVEAFDKSLDIFEDSSNPCAVAGFLEPCETKPPSCKIVCEEMLSMFCEDILEKRKEDRAAEEAKNEATDGNTTVVDATTMTMDARKRKGSRLINRTWETQAEIKQLGNNRHRRKAAKKAQNVGYQGTVAKSTVARRKEASEGDKNALWCEYEPCNCEGGVCTDECPCSVNWNFCEINCGCGADCRNAFIGCNCKGDCTKATCPCKMAARECDPDKCAECWPSVRDFSRRKRELEGITLDTEIFSSDPKLEGITEVNVKRKHEDRKAPCENMKLQLKEHAHVLLGKSPIAGWGAFFGCDAKKDDFLGEYVGEMITHGEAERRGSQYDQTNSSFLFNLNNKWVLDAYSRGNKFKFANHSKKPNCYPLVIYVRGNHRIGIYAKTDSKFGDEMFYDYGYTKDIIGEARVWAHDDDQQDQGNYRK